MRWHALLLPCLLAGPLAQGAEQKALFVTSDTETYCDHLAHLAAQHKKPPPEAASLAREGVEMCAHGAVRAGIARLRRALLIMRGAPK